MDTGIVGRRIIPRVQKASEGIRTVFSNVDKEAVVQRDSMGARFKKSIRLSKELEREHPFIITRGRKTWVI